MVMMTTMTVMRNVRYESALPAGVHTSSGVPVCLSNHSTGLSAGLHKHTLFFSKL